MVTSGFINKTSMNPRQICLSVSVFLILLRRTLLYIPNQELCWLSGQSLWAMLQGFSPNI